MIFIQALRKNDINPNGGKQVEFGKPFFESFKWTADSKNEVLIHSGKDDINTTLTVRGSQRGGVREGTDCKEYANADGSFPLKEYLIKKFSDEHVGNVFMIFESLDSFGKEFNLYFTPSKRTKEIIIENGSFLFPLQQIFYGAPGTGKSHKVKEITEKAYYDEEEREKFVFRTTFHPDYDYASFVGCYKPTETGDKITYSFVPQVFTKAYIKAWMEMKNNCGPISFKTKYGKYTINSMNDKTVTVTKAEPCKKDTVSKFWEQAWESSVFDPKKITSHSISKAICWQINELIKAKDFDNGWKALVDKISNSNGKKLELNPFNQKYIIEQGENEDTLKITTTQNSYKEAINNEFDNIESGDSTASGLANLLKKYNEFDFTDAWGKLKAAVENSNSSTGQKPNPVYLVIEEINRGNCAQIFGDLFQLLDRKKDGYSEYPIDADEDLKKYLLDANNPGIKDGKLCLPPNLYILATMNTSDQSLFPMDSAFKRRWEWEYVPIRYSKKEARDANDKFHEFKIEIGSEQYLWVDFLKKVNEKILALTDSEDKQMGEYFIKKDVDEKTFINKVMYYLWSEVGKDLYNSTQPFFVLPDGTKDSDGKDKKEFSFNELFRDNATALLKGFMKNLEVESLKSAESPKEEETMATSEE